MGGAAATSDQTGRPRAFNSFAAPAHAMQATFNAMMPAISQPPSPNRAGIALKTRMAKAQTAATVLATLAACRRHSPGGVRSERRGAMLIAYKAPLILSAIAASTSGFSISRAWNFS